MRYLRTKGIRKALRQFHFLCGIKPPYKVLIDGNFIVMCMQMKVDLNERVPKLLQVKPQECEFYIVEESLKELELLGEEFAPALQLAKSFHQLHVNKELLKSSEVNVSSAIQRLIGGHNEGKYFVATQEVELRKELRAIPGVPLLYLNRSVLVFEDISRATLAIVRQEESKQRSQLNTSEKRKLEDVSNKEIDVDNIMLQRLKKRRAKAPNPLSVKKSTKKKVRSRGRKSVQTNVEA